MKKEHKIMLGILIGVVALILLLKYLNRAKNTSYTTNNIASVNSNIPQAVQEELNYHNEGESIYYDGIKYTVIGGQWVKN